MPTTLLLAAWLVQVPQSFGDDRPPLASLPDVLAKPVPGVTLEAVPVRRAVNRVAAANGAAVVFGRNVDPTAPVSVDAADSTVAAVLDDLAAAAGAAAVPVGGAVFVGPPGDCAALPELVRRRRDELRPTRGVRREPRERALAEHDFAWDDLAEPAAVFAEMTARFGLTVENPGAVPHDLWPAGRLPAADAPAALNAVLVPFGLTFAWSADRTAVRVEPIPADSNPPPAPPLTSFAAGVPSDGAAVGTGGGEPLERRRFTLAVSGSSVRDVMAAVAASGVRFEYDARALAAGGGNLDAGANMDVTNADPDAFFTALFEPANVAFAWKGTTVTLTPVP